MKIHDLHHVLTGYQTNLRGESEIAAWELASGCRRMPAAFVLNVFALAIGALIAPRMVLRAWARGRATKNLYSHDTVATSGRPRGDIHSNHAIEFWYPDGVFADAVTAAQGFLFRAGATPANTTWLDKADRTPY